MVDVALVGAEVRRRPGHGVVHGRWAHHLGAWMVRQGHRVRRIASTRARRGLEARALDVTVNDGYRACRLCVAGRSRAP